MKKEILEILCKCGHDIHNHPDSNSNVCLNSNKVYGQFGSCSCTGWEPFFQRFRMEDGTTGMSKLPDKPSIGRIVHYVIPISNAHIAAMITWVYEDETVGLRLFYPPGHYILSDLDIRNIPYAETLQPSQPGTWHWPERV